MSRRYAIYYAPQPGSALEAFGRRWLGRDHATGRAIDQPQLERIPADRLREITRSARHYGFHATLKAPFELRPGITPSELYAAGSDFAASRAPFEAPPLDLRAISRWVAYVLSAPSSAMDELAADCVRHFDGFRTPSSVEDLARRRAAGLTPRQDEQLLRFGYPYVFLDFQFHMTLAGPVDPEEQRTALQAIGEIAPDLGGAPLVVDAIAIYEQPGRDEPFIQTARLPFGAGRSS